MGNLIEFLTDCADCYDEGVIFQGIYTDNFITDFCDCAKGVSLGNDYVVWYASNEMNEYTKENA